MQSQGFFIVNTGISEPLSNNKKERYVEMKNIKIADRTLCTEDSQFSFKEKIEVARLLERLGADTIEIPEITNFRTDALFVRTVAAFAKNSVISVCGGMTEESIENAAAALKPVNHPRIRIELPVSTVGMEYSCHKKAPKMAEFVSGLISAAKAKCGSVEFCALDATRADAGFVFEIADAAVNAGADIITVCDSAAEMMPDVFADFVAKTAEHINGKAEIAVMCSDKNGMAAASAVLAVKNGADTVKTAVCRNITELETFAGTIKNCGNSCGFESGIKYTELNRIVKQIMWITGKKAEKPAVSPVANDEEAVMLDRNDDKEAVTAAVKNLGYDLSDEDFGKVYEEFQRVADKKRVGAKELEAIIASSAMQVPPAYKLVSYVINNGNIISATAQITLMRDGEEQKGICIGDGPIDAAFRAIEQIIGHHYELDDFQIQSVTEGKEAMGSALVKLRRDGKLYSGNGISTDIIGASVRAYINAVNKIVYEEA